MTVSDIDVTTLKSCTYPYIVTVHRPGLSDVHLGFNHAYEAANACCLLVDDLHNTAHVMGTTVSWSPTPADVEPLHPVPNDHVLIADLIVQGKSNTDLPLGHAFPDLFARLKAQVGYDQASKIWSLACQLIDDDQSHIKINNEKLNQHEPLCFCLQRETNISGIPGIERVADGVLWPDDTVAIRWRTIPASTEIFDNITAVEKIHKHNGTTRIVWLK